MGDARTPEARNQGLFIDGSWELPERTAEVRDRWSGESIGTVAIGTAEDARRAADAAAGAQARGLPVHERADVLERVSHYITEHAEEFAALITAEVGKPITASRGEVARAASTLRIAADEARRLPSETVPISAYGAGLGTVAYTVAEPRGVVAAITPFNFPLNLVVHKLGPALAAGNAVVLKPANYTPLTAGLLVQAFEQSGLPAGWLNLVTGPAAEIAGAWLEDDRVAIITFTGSSAVGWQLKADSPRKLHVLELGSNTAMLVTGSADLEQAAEDAVSACFTNSGQACISLQRLYVTADAAERFLPLLEKAVAGIRTGDPYDPATLVGPLVADKETDRLVAWIASAEAQGARRVAGGEVVEGVLQPTVLADVPRVAELVCNEAFGPVMVVNTVADLEAGIAEVNASDYGLNASIYTADLAEALGYADAAEAGSVLVNMPPSFRTDHMPYGGVKGSGQGREGVRYAVEEMVKQKLVIIQPGRSR